MYEIDHIVHKLPISILISNNHYLFFFLKSFILEKRLYFPAAVRFKLILLDGLFFIIINFWEQLLEQRMMVLNAAFMVLVMFWLRFQLVQTKML